MAPSPGRVVVAMGWHSPGRHSYPATAMAAVSRPDKGDIGHTHGASMRRFLFWVETTGHKSRSVGHGSSMSALADSSRTSGEVREWDGPAVLPPLTGAAPCAVSLDRWPDCRDQSDPQLPIGARHYRTPRPSLPAAIATTSSGHPHRCVIATNDQDYRGPQQRLAPSR